MIPHYTSTLSEKKKKITVHNLLNMSGGLRSTSYKNYGGWIETKDWVETALLEPMVSNPDEKFIYSIGNYHILSEIISTTTKKRIYEFAKENLFDQLKIIGLSWEKDPFGRYFGGNELAIRLCDFAKFGQLYLNRGYWNHEQIFPSTWINILISNQRSSDNQRYGNYALSWWIRSSNELTLIAVGYGGQYLYLIPSKGILVAIVSTTSKKSESWTNRVFEIIENNLILSLDDLILEAPNVQTSRLE